MRASPVETPLVDILSFVNEVAKFYFGSQRATTEPNKPIQKSKINLLNRFFPYYLQEDHSNAGEFNVRVQSLACQISHMNSAGKKCRLKGFLTKVRSPIKGIWKHLYFGYVGFWWWVLWILLLRKILIKSWDDNCKCCYILSSIRKIILLKNLDFIR